MLNRRTFTRSIIATAAIPGCASLKANMTNHALFELRDYSLHQGQREILIDLFEAHFIESQNELGAHVRAIFRDIDRPDHFVWIRSFENMPARLAALQAFYSGPIWRAHRNEANATMIDSDDVHLLRAASTGGLAGPNIDGALIIIDVLPDVSAHDLTAALSGRQDILGFFRTEAVENNFPALPVHAEKVAVIMRVTQSFGYPNPIAGLPAALHRLRLRPTARSPIQLKGPVQTRQDFDFLAGDWRVHNRKLKVRNKGLNDWEEFPATHHFSTLLDGVANVDEFVCPAKGFKGMSVRALDQKTGIWSIYWIDSRSGVLFPPVRGGFNGSTGEFAGEDTDGPQAILCRFHWTRDPSSPRWEQAFSYDQGATWEVNWIMEFSRA
jgi:quinol monooxygenase YgiN